MKGKFRGYYKPQQSEFEKLWKESIFIFDTNVLFDFYRYSDETVTVLFSIFEKIKENIWIPNWVGMEYHQGLEDRIKEQVDKYTSTLKDLENFSNKIKSQREHPFLSTELQAKVESFCEELNHELNSLKGKLKTLITENPVKEKIAQLVGDNIGDKLSEEEKKEIVKEGDSRLPNDIPPGFVDYKDKNNRPGLDKYGDFIIWKQILKHIKNNKKSVIFVTFDKKEDWYKIIRFSNSKIYWGPRPELIEEFQEITECDIWFYSTTDFIENATKYLDIEIEASKLEKAKEETTLIDNKEYDGENCSEIQNENESSEISKQDMIGDTASNESDTAEPSGTT